MTTLEKSWKLLSMKFNNDLLNALQQQHHAAQFIALVGHHLIPKKADDSNTNMEYLSNGMLLQGNPLVSGLRLVLQLTTLEIGILDKDNDLKSVISLDGKTKNEAFEELKDSFSDLGVDVTDFKNELHYELPEHDLNNEATFKLGDEENNIENAIVRHNAEIVLGEIAKAFEKAEAVRMWPHHFDTGSFIPVSYNEKEELSQSVGIGLAIPDSMVSEPYFYLSFWSAEALQNLNKLNALDAGDWMTPGWNGAVLKYSEILMQDSAEKQYDLVKSFYDQGIEMILQLLKSN